MNVEFWKGKKILVTGHTGFKGGWLTLWLQKLGAEVIGVSLDPPSNPNLYNHARVADGMVSIHEDIRNLKKMQEIFVANQPEIVFHMAAQPLVRYSYKDPVETYSTNVMGSLNILEAVRYCKSVRAVVMVTTDKCYENHEWEWGYREYEPMGGRDPYSSSKACAELLIASYRYSFFPLQEFSNHQTAIASARAGNVIGGGDWAEDRLLPDIIRAFQSNQTIRIRNPHAVRPWQHVLEPLSGYLELAERMYLDGMKWAEAWNFGPNQDDAKPVEWIVKKMANIWGNSASWEIDDGDHPYETSYLKLDCSKAHALLRWKPRWDLDKALEMLVRWYKETSSGADARELCLNQISEFMISNG